MALCPAYAQKRCATIDFNLFYCRWAQREFGKLESPSRAYIDPEVSRRAHEASLAAFDVEWSVSAPYEMRPVLWAGGYMEKEEKWAHIGRDVNVPAGTALFADHRMEVFGITTDHPEKGGWGTMLHLRMLDLPYDLVFGHVQPLSSLKIGSILLPAQQFAVVDTPATNGHWYSHTHVQPTAHGEAAEYYRQHPEGFDGYGSEKDLERLKRWHPDPIELGLIRLT